LLVVVLVVMVVQGEVAVEVQVVYFIFLLKL
jgi:hypothetical protein